jgi:exodeoxyribonuclease VII small subunit
MSLFERGLGLSQVSQEKLKDAEQKVQILMDNKGVNKLEGFNYDENSQ